MAYQENLINDMQRILSPQRIATERFTDADAAVVRLIEIYERNARFLRDCFEAYVNGEVRSRRVRATYPFVRILISTHARLDSHLSYGFVAGPGLHETTVTRPDLFRTYLTEQIRLLIENHGVPVIVTFVDEEAEARKTLQIVGEPKADSRHRKIFRRSRVH